MPDLTVIEGDGKRRDYDDDWSRHHFHSLIIELLRSVARGHDAGARVQRDLVELYRHLSKTETPLREIINETLQEVHEDAIALDEDHLDSLDNDLREILRSALQLSAESMCHDPGARGRSSKRLHILLEEINRMVENRRRRRIRR